jgi:hypothetical protein
LLDESAEGIDLRNTNKRRDVGGRAWHYMIDQIIDSERQEIKKLRFLRQNTNDCESLQVIADLQEGKMIRVIELEQLYDYREPIEKKARNEIEPLFPNCE